MYIYTNRNYPSNTYKYIRMFIYKCTNTSDSINAYTNICVCYNTDTRLFVHTNLYTVCLNVTLQSENNYKLTEHIMKNKCNFKFII